MREKIAVDMDWVIAKLTHKWVDTYNEMYGDNLTVDDITTWDMSDHVKDDAKVGIFEILKLPGFYRDLEVVKDSQRVLKKLSEDYEIIIASDPFKKETMSCKWEWLEEHFDFIPTKNYTFTGNKSNVKADYLIDDGIHNLEVFTGTPILYDAPYNREEDRFYRVCNWNEIEEIFTSKIQKVKDYYK